MNHRILFFLFIPTLFFNMVNTAGGAVSSCNSCLDCTSKIAAAQPGDSVELSQDIISNSGSYCIDFGTSQGVIFDGKGYEVSYGSSGYRGIYFSSDSAVGNTVRNVDVVGFSMGIYVIRGGNNTFENSRMIANNTGIDFYSSHGNIIDNLLIKQNFTGINVGYDSDDNIIRNSFIIGNHNSGITFFPRSGVGDPENNLVYNNVLDNNGDYNVWINSISSDESRDLSFITFNLSLSLDCSGGANVMGCGCMGGNYWGGSQASDFSKACSDADANGICDSSYTISHSSANLTDNSPLTALPAGCCADSDRDGDTYSAVLCGGNDHDDDPVSCGAACYPSATEICDGYDNDGDGMADGTISCQEQIIYKKATLPIVVNDQSCVEVPDLKKIFCFGGSSYGSSTYLDSIIKYDPNADTVEELTSTLPSGRSDLTCSYASNTERIYCFGGYSQVVICDEYNEHGGCIRAHSILTRVNEIVEFNPADDSISTLTLTLPVRVEGMSSVWSDVNSTIFLFGGTSSVHLGNRDWILEFDPVAETLRTSSALLPSPRYGPSCGANSSTGKIYCFGGYGVGDGSGDDVSEIVEFDPSTDSLQVMGAAFTDGIHSTPCVEDSVDNIFYCLAGRSRHTTGSMYSTEKRIMAYNPETDTLVERPAKFLQARYGHACVEMSSTNKIYCFGGASNVVNRREIVEYTPYLPALGDVDEDGDVGLTDLVHTLQVPAGLGSAGLNRKADVGGDRRLGLEESVYILRRKAGL